MPRPRRIDAPEPGYFRMRLVKRAPWIGARIYTCFDMLVADCNGGWHVDVDRVWTSGIEITKDEYDELIANAPAFPGRPLNVREEAPYF